jgi:hypothetical protein
MKILKIVLSIMLGLVLLVQAIPHGKKENVKEIKIIF